MKGHRRLRNRFGAKVRLRFASRSGQELSSSGMRMEEGALLHNAE